MGFIRVVFSNLGEPLFGERGLSFLCVCTCVCILQCECIYAMCRQKVGNRYLPPSFLHLNFDKGSVTDPVTQLLTSWLAHKLWRFPVLYLPSSRVAGVCCYTYFYIGTRFPNSGSHMCVVLTLPPNHL